MPKKIPPKKRNPLPIIFLGIGGALLIASIFLMLPKPQPVAPTPIPGTPFAARVSLAEAKKAFDAGSAVFLDVRSAESYQAARIPGARSIPELDLPTRYSELDKNAWIITYCT